MLWKVVLSLCAAVGVTTAGVIQAIPGGVSSQSNQRDIFGNFAFNYHVTDPLGATKGRSEAGDVYGNRIGSYSITDIDGRARHVNYIADAAGFRAAVKTNEPGTAGGLVTHGAPAVATVHAAAPVAHTSVTYGAAPGAVYAAGPAPVVASAHAAFVAAPSAGVLRAAPAYAYAPVRNLIGVPSPAVYTTHAAHAPIYGTNVVQNIHAAPALNAVPAAPIAIRPAVAPVPVAAPAFPQTTYPVSISNHYAPGPVAASTPPVFVDENVHHPFRATFPAIDYTREQIIRQSQPMRPAPDAVPSPPNVLTPTFQPEAPQAVPPGTAVAPTFSGDTEEAPANVQTPTFSRDTEQAPANVRTPSFSNGAQQFSFSSSNFRQAGAGNAQGFSFNPLQNFQQSQGPSFRSAFQTPGITYASDANLIAPRLGRSVPASEGPGGPEPQGPGPRSFGAGPPQGGPPGPGGPPPPNGPGGPPPNGPGPNPEGGPPPPKPKRIKGIRITTARPVRFEIVQKTALAHIEPIVDLPVVPIVPVAVGLDIPRK